MKIVHSRTKGNRVELLLEVKTSTGERVQLLKLWEIDKRKKGVDREYIFKLNGHYKTIEEAIENELIPKDIKGVPYKRQGELYFAKIYDRDFKVKGEFIRYRYLLRKGEIKRHEELDDHEPTYIIVNGLPENGYLFLFFSEPENVYLFFSEIPLANLLVSGKVYHRHGDHAVLDISDGWYRVYKSPKQGIPIRDDMNMDVTD
jgi:hypothetical protein